MLEKTETRPPPTESEFVREAQTGNTEAFGQLFGKSRQRLTDFLIKRVGEEKAQDILGDVFIKAWLAMPDYEPRPGIPFGVWLFKITKNDWLSELRKQERERTRPIREPDQLLESDESSESRADFNFKLEDIGQILSPGENKFFY